MTRGEEHDEARRARVVAAWWTGRRAEVERWIEDACRGAILRVRGVLADEIRSVARRVDRLHELLDNLERIVEAGEEEAQGERAGQADEEEHDGR